MLTNLVHLVANVLNWLTCFNLCRIETGKMETVRISETLTTHPTLLSRERKSRIIMLSDEETRPILRSCLEEKNGTRNKSSVPAFEPGSYQLRARPMTSSPYL